MFVNRVLGGPWCLLTKKRVGSSHDVALSVYNYILGFLARRLEDCHRLRSLAWLHARRHTRLHAADGDHGRHGGAEERLLVGDVRGDDVQWRLAAGLRQRGLTLLPPGDSDPNRTRPVYSSGRTALLHVVSTGERAHARETLQRLRGRVVARHRHGRVRVWLVDDAMGRGQIHDVRVGDAFRERRQLVTAAVHAAVDAAGTAVVAAAGVVDALAVRVRLVSQTAVSAATAALLLSLAVTAAAAVLRVHVIVQEGILDCRRAFYTHMVDDHTYALYNTPSTTNHGDNEHGCNSAP